MKKNQIKLVDYTSLKNVQFLYMYHGKYELDNYKIFNGIKLGFFTISTSELIELNYKIYENQWVNFDGVEYALYGLNSDSFYEYIKESDTFNRLNTELVNLNSKANNVTEIVEKKLSSLIHPIRSIKNMFKSLKLKEDIFKNKLYLNMNKFQFNYYWFSNPITEDQFKSIESSSKYRSPFFYQNILRYYLLGVKFLIALIIGGIVALGILINANIIN